MDVTTQMKKTLPAPTLRLVVMLYDGAIAALQETIGAIGRKDQKATLRSASMVNGILAQLRLALDNEDSAEKNGKAALNSAANFERIYGYLMHRLKRVSLMGDKDAASEVLELLQHLYQSWREAHYQMTFEQAAYARSTPPATDSRPGSASDQHALGQTAK